jgi:hypothetical protein
MRRAEHLSFQSGCPLKMKDIVRHKDLGEGKVVGLPDKGVDPEAHNYNKAWVHFIKDQTKLWVTWSSLKIITAQAAAKRVADREQVRPPPRSLPPNPPDCGFLASQCLSDPLLPLLRTRSRAPCSRSSSQPHVSFVISMQRTTCLRWRRSSATAR